MSQRPVGKATRGAAFIKQEYDRLLSETHDGSGWKKVDLQIHTPGSSDFKLNGIPYDKLTLDEVIKVAVEEHLIKPELAEQLGQLREGEVSMDGLIAELIVWKAIRSDINLICITDHFNYRWIDRVQQAVFRVRKHKKLRFAPHVLSGVEISDTENTHVIAIFPCNSSERVHQLLQKIGVPEDRFGKEHIHVDRTLIKILQYIQELNGIAYLPHVDSGKKFQDTFAGSTEKWRDVFSNPCLAAVGVTNIRRKDALRHYLREKGLADIADNVAIIVDSDAHDLDQIGSRSVWMKMSKSGFDGASFALQNPTSHIMYEEPILPDRSMLVGMTIKGGLFRSTDGIPGEAETADFRFGRDLTCIIGGRGTGKSTALRLVRLCLRGELEKAKHRRFFAQFESVTLYFKRDKKTYAVRMEPKVVWDPYTESREIDRGHSDASLSIAHWLSFYVQHNEGGRFSQLPVNQVFEMFLDEKWVNFHSQNSIVETTESPIQMLDVLDEMIMYSTEYAKRFRRAVAEYERIRERWLAEFHRQFTRGDVEEPFKDTTAELMTQFERTQTVRREVVATLNEQLVERVKLQVQNDWQNSWYDLLSNRLGALELGPRSRRQGAGSIGEYINSLLTTAIYDRLSPQELLTILAAGDSDKFWNLIDLDDYRPDKVGRDPLVFNKNELFNELRLISKHIRSERWLEAMLQPALHVEYNSNWGRSGASGTRFEHLDTLSPGQRSVAFLDLVLHGGTLLGDTRPLVMDQPEDQIDNRYVFHSLVDAFQKVKGRRQVIYVTHNANLAVGANTEQIISLDATNSRAWIRRYGGLDDSRIRKEVILTLEGGEDALEHRLRNYDATRAFRQDSDIRI